jgi:hypothetical protein
MGVLNKAVLILDTQKAKILLVNFLQMSEAGSLYII